MELNDTGYDNPRSNHVLKITGTVFGLIIAPVIAGIIANIGSFFVQKKLEAPPPDNKTPVAATPGDAKSAPTLVAAAASPSATTSVPATKPDALASPSISSASLSPSHDAAKKVDPAFQEGLDRLHALPVNHIFNGRDLSGFYTYIGSKDEESKPIGKNHDPDHVFLVDKGLIHISGKEPGALTTVDAYENYLLTAEYRWGVKTWAARKGFARFGALSFHAFGADGCYRNMWLRGYRARLDEAGGGDLGILPDNNGSEPKVSVPVDSYQTVTAKKGERTNYVYKPGAPPREFGPGSHILRLGTINPASRYVPGSPAGTIWEKPTGEWNTIEICCVGDSIGIILNGALVNVGSKADHTKGKIQITTERADIFIRTFDLRSIPRGFPMLPGMPKPSASPAIATAKATAKPPVQRSERSAPAKVKVKSHTTRAEPKK